VIAENRDDNVDPIRRMLARAALDGIELNRKNKLAADAKDKDDKREIKKDK
jgi:hypothetical protein